MKAITARRAATKVPAREATKAEGKRPGDPSAPPLPGPDIPLPELLKRAEAGDAKVRLRLRALLGRGLDREYRHLELSPMLEYQLVEGLCPEGLLEQEILIREIRRTAEEVAGPDASPLERLLAHRVAVCQNVLHHIEWRREAELVASQVLKQGLSDARIEFHDRRTDGAQRRLLQAVKMLATVHRLQGPGPTVSVKVRQTVNVEAPEGRPSAPGLSIPELMTAAPRG